MSFFDKLRNQKCYCVGFSIAAILFTALLLASKIDVGSPSYNSYLEYYTEEAVGAVDDTAIQWIIFLCLVSYFLLFRLAGNTARRLRSTSKGEGYSLYLYYVVLAGVMAYTFPYSPSLAALMLISGATIGQAALFWKLRKQPETIGNLFVAIAIFGVTCFLTFTSFWTSPAVHVFQYHTHIRWSGPWKNPNIAGLFMGTGIILAVGQIMQELASRYSCLTLRCRQGLIELKCYPIIVFLLAAIVSMGTGLVRSYSRGSWVALLCGLGFLMYKTFNGRMLSKNWISFYVILVSSLVLTYWCHYQTKSPLLNRTFSIGDRNDFSSSNRLKASLGILQMMADKPWLGLGWNRAEFLYNKYYSVTGLDETAAIQLNDYLILGVALGVPALGCFLNYVTLSLFDFDRGAFSSPIWERGIIVEQAVWTKVICRSGAVVLATGFWFDGGLFKLSTAAVFWILLEVGREA